MSPAGAPAGGSLAVVVRLLPVLLLIATAATGCGYFESEEPHLAPSTPLLPPTSEALGAPTALTPTSVAPAGQDAAAPPATADANGSETDQLAASDGEGAAGDGGTSASSPGGETDGGDGETDAGDGTAGEPADDEPQAPQLLEIVVIGEMSHDTEAFTQGFEISGGRLWESTGARAERSSTLRELDRTTGEVLRLETFTEDFFAEGLTFVDGRVYQLTWKDGVALVWDPEELSEVQRFTYEGQGWGLCYNGQVLVMSDGSNELHFRDPVTFEQVGDPVPVTLNGEELPSLNELECFRDEQNRDRVYANVWQTDLIVRIDLLTGRVVALADASDIGLPRPDDPNAVLNGIAWDPATGTFLITGKDWPAIYEVRFEAARADQ